MFIGCKNSSYRSIRTNQFCYFRSLTLHLKYNGNSRIEDKMFPEKIPIKQKQYGFRIELRIVVFITHFSVLDETYARLEAGSKEKMKLKANPPQFNFFLFLCRTINYTNKRIEVQKNFVSKKPV